MGRATCLPNTIAPCMPGLMAFTHMAPGWTDMRGLYLQGGAVCCRCLRLALMFALRLALVLALGMAAAGLTRRSADVAPPCEVPLSRDGPDYRAFLAVGAQRLFSS